MSEAQEATRSTRIGTGVETVFRSVGIDVGSSTTHLTVSEVVVGRRDSHFHRKPEVLDRRAIYRSPVIFTPFLNDGGVIDHDAIAAFVQDSYSQAGIDLSDIDTGAVICTGEAARRQNAKAITESLAKESGKFVCASAGHHFEAMLAAHGSGSVEISHHFDGLTINLDIGGGTTKRTAIRDGEIENTAAINVGARLIGVAPDGMVTRAEPAGLVIAQSLGIDAARGRRLDFDQQHALATEMARLILQFLGLDRMTELARKLLLTEPPAPLPDRLILTTPPRCVPLPFRLLCSGGVSEFIYDRADVDPGDLGPLLGHALRMKLFERLPEEWLAIPREGIRATVIGACQFTLQASGDTVYLSDKDVVPVSNVPVLIVPMDWNNITAEAVAAATVKALGVADQNSPCALYYGGPKQFGYGRLPHLARGIADGCRHYPVQDTVQDKRIFVFSHNIANTLGQELRQYLPERTRFLCLDEIEVGNLDYLDVAAPPPGESYLPVVVKSLVFARSKVK